MTPRVPPQGSKARLDQSSGGLSEALDARILAAASGLAAVAAAPHPSAPPPTTVKGAQTAGCAAHGRRSSLLRASIARRKASARPSPGDRRISAKVRLV